MAMRILIPLAAGAAIVAVLASSPSQGASVAMPVPKTIIPASGPREVAYFAGGCFWGVEGVFEHVRGVQSAVSGYAGGATAKPTYDSVSAGSTGHAEVVRVTFDPRVVRYADLMRSWRQLVNKPAPSAREVASG